MTRFNPALKTRHKGKMKENDDRLYPPPRLKETLAQQANSDEPCNPYVQNLKALKTLEDDLTTVKENSGPFWTQQSENISKKIWLPIKTNDGSDTVIWAGRSWFTITKTSFLNSESLSEYYKYSKQSASSDTGKKSKPKRDKKLHKTRKYRVFPTSEQETILTQWFGISR